MSLLQKIKIIAKHYGLKRQLRKTMEECVELAAECNTLSKNPQDDYYAVVDEMADVQIMLEQLRELLPPEATELLKKRIEYKVDRQIKRMANEQEGD